MNKEPLPVHPPVAERVAPPTLSMEEPVATEKKDVSNLRRLLVAGSMLVAGAGALLVSCNDDSVSNKAERSNSTNPVEVLDKAAQETKDNCPNGIFDPAAPMAAIGMVRPGDLHVRPLKPISNDTEFRNYMFGERTNNTEVQKGVLCALPTSLAVMQKVFDSWVGGDGTSGRPFGSNMVMGANELAAFYAANPTEAEKAVKSDNFNAFVESMNDNKDIINAGTYFELTLVGDQIVQVPVDLPEIKPGQVRTLGNKVMIGDMSFSGNDQVVLMDNEVGKVYVLNSLGDVPTIAPEQTTTTEAGQDTGAHADNNNNEGDNAQDNGGGNQGVRQGNAGTGGSAGPDGTNPEAGPGGVTDSPANGGGSNPGKPGTTTVTSSIPGRPTITVTVPTTRPTTTTTRPTTTTTRPTTTTTRPAPTTTKGPENATTVPPTTAPDIGWS